MAECTDPNNQKVSAANPENQVTNSGALDVNLEATGADIFNPNLALAAVQTFNTMNNVANKMFGIETRWFRAVPQQRSKDVLFQEYTLSCVEDTPICVKVIIPDGNLPDSKYNFDLMGLEYEVPTEIQIDKRYWEETAGFGTAPQKKDIVYLVIPNRLYQVESSYLKRGFMEQETTWVVNLIKYQPEASRKEGDALKETIDQYTVSTESLFGEEIEDNIEKLVDDKQMSAFNSTSQDKYKELDPNLKVVAYNLDIHGIVVSDSVYDLSTSDVYNAVTYKNSKETITASMDRAITTWLSPKQTEHKETSVISITADSTITTPANYIIHIKGTKKYAINDTFVIYRSDTQVFYAEVIDDTLANDGKYYCKVDQQIIDYLTSIQLGWSDKKNWKMIVKDPITILDGINETESGLIAKVYANRYIKVKYGLQEYISIMNDKLIDGDWYGFVINIGNSWGQYNINVWKPSLLDTAEKLQSIFYETVNFTPEQTEIDRYTINKSDTYMTNIRLFNSTIEEEKQINELLSYFTQNADDALILDNSDPKLTIPYISEQR